MRFWTFYGILNQREAIEISHPAACTRLPHSVLCDITHSLEQPGEGRTLYGVDTGLEAQPFLLP